MREEAWNRANYYAIGWQSVDPFRLIDALTRLLDTADP
jgi:hypothetical protein